MVSERKQISAIKNKGFKKFQQKPNTFNFSTGYQEIKLDQLQYTPINVILNIFLFHVPCKIFLISFFCSLKFVGIWQRNMGLSRGNCQ